MVDWFAARPVLGLDIILITLPFVAFVIGCTVVVRQWRSDERLRASTAAALSAGRAHLPWLVVAVATFVAGSILAIVALHMITE